jgi:thiaminase
MTKELALDHYLRHWFSQFTKSEIKDWVNNKIDLLEQLEKKEKTAKYEKSK